MKAHILLLIIIETAQAAEERAVCIVSVADLVGHPLGTPGTNAEQEYHTLPLDGPASAVKRIGQLLYNEVVTIAPSKEPHADDETKVTVSAYFYCAGADKTPRTTYWTLKKNLLPLSQLPETAHIPDARDYQDPKPDHGVITLLSAWTDPVTDRHYSAGTRFVRASEQNNQYTIHTLSNDYQPITINLPRELGLEPETLDQEERVTQFLEIMRWFAHQPYGHVPYVWGGMSMDAPYKKSAPLYIVDRAFDAPKPHKGPYSGFDCAKLIIGSAQMAGLPFFYANSSAIANYLKPLQTAEDIQVGDIISMTGHVLIASDIDKNHIIEARTACDGYGLVHECPLNEIFKEISTYQELKKVYLAGQYLTRIARNGAVIVHPEVGSNTARVRVQIFKLRSIFDQLKMEDEKSGAPDRN